MPRGFRWIHDLKKQTHKTTPELLALCRQRDPFFVGSPANVKQAEWFARMWEYEYKDKTGIHIRRVHYHLDAIGFPKLNGMPYRNYKADYKQLDECSRVSRILELVPADAFDDHRNADPYPLNWRTAGVREPSVIDAASQYGWSLPSLRLDLSLSGWTLETPSVDGYNPDDYLDRAYYLELWIEKSTMDDILVPLTHELGIRLVTSIGFQSISNAVKLLQRIREIKKPARIFYVSDYDKAGRAMPIAVSRQIEFWIEKYAPGADVKLMPLALTEEQIARYKLPYSGIDKKKKTVELDALEAIVPGELAKIVRRAVEPYLDRCIDDQLVETENDANDIIEQEWSNLMEPHKRRLEALHQRVEAVTKKYGREAAALNNRLQRDLEQFKKPLAKLRSEVSEASSDFNPSLPPRPAQSESEQHEADCLFDSSRSYLDQLRFYKAQHR